MNKSIDAIKHIPNETTENLVSLHRSITNTRTHKGQKARQVFQHLVICVIFHQI
jgi:hypothetical protein